jgi:putative ABC transport system permease protein
MARSHRRQIGFGRRWSVAAEPSRLSPRDLASEAIGGITRRPARSALTMLGTVLGVGAFVAVLGFTATASAQIGRQFSVLTATTVTITDAGAQQAAVEGRKSAPLDFPPDAEQRVEGLHGVAAAGVWWQVSFSGTPVISAALGTLVGSNADFGSTTPVYAATPGMFRVMGATLGTGVFFSAFHQQRGEHVCVLGGALAAQLGISQLDGQPAVFINDVAFTVVGIMRGAAEYPDMLLGIIIPARTAERLYGPPASGSPAQMLIRTKLGAAPLVARQAPVALDPVSPGVLTAVPPPNPRELRTAVSTTLTGLFFALAIICLIIGAVGIANTTLVAVLERTGEIGLRRALGALRRHIVAQFLAESAAIGLLGGLIGTAVAVASVVLFAVARHWTAVLDPVTVLPAPLIGAGTGLLAGLYPAIRASLIEPLAALRR